MIVYFHRIRRVLIILTKGTFHQPLITTMEEISSISRYVYIDICMLFFAKIL